MKQSKFLCSLICMLNERDRERERQYWLINNSYNRNSYCTIPYGAATSKTALSIYGIQYTSMLFVLMKFMRLMMTTTTNYKRRRSNITKNTSVLLTETVQKKFAGTENQINWLLCMTVCSLIFRLIFLFLSTDAVMFCCFFVCFVFVSLYIHTLSLSLSRCTVLFLCSLFRFSLIRCANNFALSFHCSVLMNGFGKNKEKNNKTAVFAVKFQFQWRIQWECRRQETTKKFHKFGIFQLDQIIGVSNLEFKIPVQNLKLK